jgi:pimeloyl-ACP methyl ester carboxylesterase
VTGRPRSTVDHLAAQPRAAAIPGARFHLLPATGHVPQAESPAQLLAAIADFAVRVRTLG